MWREYQNLFDNSVYAADTPWHGSRPPSTDGISAHFEIALFYDFSTRTCDHTRDGGAAKIDLAMRRSDGLGKGDVS